MARNKTRQYEITPTIKRTGKDTITWQALVRTGGRVDGKSPVYTLTRVKRTSGKKPAK